MNQIIRPLLPLLTIEIVILIFVTYWPPLPVAAPDLWVRHVRGSSDGTVRTTEEPQPPRAECRGRLFSMADVGVLGVPEQATRKGSHGQDDGRPC